MNLATSVKRTYRKTPKWLRIAFFVLVGLYAAYVVAVNVVLRTSLLRGWLSKKPEAMKVDYDSAWSLFPGHVHVYGFALRFQDDNVQMRLAFEEAYFEIDLFSLAKKTFRVTKIRSEGTTFLLRNKVLDVKGSEGRIAAFPKIEGFSDPPLRVDTKKPPISDEDYDLWTIALENVSASVREVWTEEYRYRGLGALAGGFRLRPQRELWVSPSVMTMREGTLSLGDRELMKPVSGTIEARIDPYDVRQKGLAPFRHMNARIHQEGTLVSLGSIGATYLPRSPVVLDGGSGPMSIDIHVEQGIFQTDSRVSYATKEAVVKTPVAVVRAETSLLVRVDMAGDTRVLVAEGVTKHAAVTRPDPRPGRDTEGPVLDVRDLRVAVDLTGADLAQEMELGGVDASLGSAHAPNIAVLQPLAPEKISFENGAATFAGRAKWRGGKTEGRADVALTDARVILGTVGVVASGKAWANLVSLDRASAFALPGSGADLTNVGVESGSGTARGLWLRTRVTSSVIDTGRGDADVDADAVSGPGDRTLQFFTRMAKLPDLAAEAAAGDDMKAALHVQVRPDDVSVAIKGRNGALEGRGRVRKRGERPPTAAFLVSMGPVKVGLDLEGNGDGMGVHPFASEAWLEERLKVR